MRRILSYMVTSAAVLVAVMSGRAEDWSESTLYITRYGPVEPAVQKHGEGRDGRAEENVSKVERRGAAESSGEVKRSERGLERGIMQVTPARMAAREEGARGSASGAEKSGAMKTDEASLLRGKQEGTGARGAQVKVDKFVDHNQDGYDDRAEAEDL
ncbi:MAG: hypothetical protein N2595_07845 [bacterium]|nr:hypothetical protein [bacterium]